MHLVDTLQDVMLRLGAEWVMWLMLALSVVSVVIAVERAWFYWSIQEDVGKLARELRRLLLAGDVEGACARMEHSKSAEAAVVLAGLRDADGGSKAAQEAMQGALALQRKRLEARLVYLGTLGSNAPFIGLFGTVLGVVAAFQALGTDAGAAAATAGASAGVMAAISEALVATAVGLAVAIPAVIAFNYFKRQTSAILANTDALSRVLLAYIARVENGGQVLDFTPRRDSSPEVEEAA